MHKLLFILLGASCLLGYSCGSKHFSQSSRNSAHLEVVPSSFTGESSTTLAKPAEILELASATLGYNDIGLLPNKISQNYVTADLPNIRKNTQAVNKIKPADKTEQVISSQASEPLEEEPEEKLKTNRMAAASFILGLLSWVLAPALYFLVLPLLVLAVIYAVRAINEINASDGKQKGKGFAQVGFILGGLGLIGFLTAAFVSLWILMFFW